QVRHQTTSGRSGQIALHGSLSLRASLRGQSAVIPSIHVNSFPSRPYFAIRRASMYLPERPHLAHSIRSSPTLPISSEKMIVPSRGIRYAVLPALPSRFTHSVEQAELADPSEKMIAPSRLVGGDILSSPSRRECRSRCAVQSFALLCKKSLERGHKLR